MVYDLFGEIPVTWPEIYAWVEEETGMKQDNHRTAYYVKYWNVAEKIRRQKLEQEPVGLSNKLGARRKRKPSQRRKPV